ncbi:LpqB family beta-propeller domain-containing protein [Murinocardiopsis flavida]|uniref:LpqB family beta-propeller domain-containing protein n=1 Tax=Murinocardiopsis flavida TaxID=645275 RepID=UPI000D0D0B8B
MCLAALLTSCASVPTGGPIVAGGGGENGRGHQDDYVRLLPAGPQQDVGEERLVRDFLRDMGSLEEDHRAARLFMTGDEQRQWRPNGTVLVYDEIRDADFTVSTAADGESATVRMRADQVASIDHGGQYLPVDKGERIDTVFTLAKAKGQWRIADLPDELLLSRRDIDRVYRPLNLYYFNQDDSTLVPDPVFIPASTEEIPTRLVRMLVNGPTEWLAPAVRTAFPKDTKVAVASSGGRVTVQLRSTGGSPDQGESFRMGAQIAWTLRQLAEVQEFTVEVNGEETPIPGGQDGVQQVSGRLWDSVNPSVGSDSEHAYFTREGQLWSLSAGSGKQNADPVPGPAGAGSAPLEQYAVSVREGLVAGIDAAEKDSTSVLVADLSDGSEYRTVLKDGDYTSLSWDGYDNLWVVQDLGSGADSEEEREADSAADDTERGPERDPADPAPPDERADDDPESGATRLWQVDDGKPTRVEAPELDDRTVTRLRASRDGTRVAVLLEEDDTSRLYVGRVTEHDGEVRLDRFKPLGSDLTEVTDVAWRGADQLAVLGKRGGAVLGYLVRLDGNAESTSASAPPGADMKTIAAAPGQPLLSGAEDDRIWMTNDRVTWQRITDGTNPVYPG